MPLEDIRILALEQYGAGPFGSVHLADLGAEVIKIEDPRFGGDISRQVSPFADDGDSLFFETFNRNKRSIALDLSDGEDRAIFEKLVRKSDAVYSNLRGDVPEKLRIRYADLKHLNERVVCVSLSGFGATGPRSNQPGYDYVLQALAGWMSLTGEPDSPPAKSGLSLVDYSGGYVAALSLLSGVHKARRDGKGMDCDVSLFDVAITMLTYPATWFLNRSWEPIRKDRSAHPSLVPFQAFEASDGWFVIGCAKQKFFERLAHAVELPELLTDSRFADFDGRRLSSGELIAMLDEVFVRRTVAEWVDVLEAAGVPCGPVQNVAEALADPQTTERGLIVETDHPRFGVVRQLASPVRVGDSVPDYRRGPRIDEDRAYVLQNLLGMDETMTDGRK